MFALPPPLALRPALDADEAFMRILYASTRDDLRQLPLPAALLENLLAMQQRAHEDGRRAAFPRSAVLILDVEGEPAGRFVLDTSGQAWRVIDIALLPAMRGRGLARAVLGAMQRHAAAHGACIGLSVQRGNAVALRLYGACGFAVSGSDDLHHEMVWPAPCPTR